MSGRVLKTYRDVLFMTSKMSVKHLLDAIDRTGKHVYDPLLWEKYASRALALLPDMTPSAVTRILFGFHRAGYSDMVPQICDSLIKSPDIWSKMLATDCAQIMKALSCHNCFHTEVIDKCQEVLKEQVDGLSAADIRMVLLSFLKFIQEGLLKKCETVDLLIECASSKIGSLSPTEISQTCAAAVILSDPMTPECLGLFASVSSWVLNNSYKLGAKDSAMLLIAAGRVSERCSKRDLVDQQFIQRLSARLSSNCHELTQIGDALGGLSACAKLGFYDSKHLSGLMTFILQRLHALSSNEIVKLMDTISILYTIADNNRILLMSNAVQLKLCNAVQVPIIESSFDVTTLQNIIKVLPHEISTRRSEFSNSDLNNIEKTFSAFSCKMD
eukprot:GHVL01010891.1.p1 GENE.GHVL01010891.1~~GHVL01010891.1.p1  ORF type:complete len:386 (-),score=52.83 GHVL01010891.1:189-1346(-)